MRPPPPNPLLLLRERRRKRPRVLLRVHQPPEIPNSDFCRPEKFCSRTQSSAAMHPRPQPSRSEWPAPSPPSLCHPRSQSSPKCARLLAGQLQFRDPTSKRAHVCCTTEFDARNPPRSTLLLHYLSFKTRSNCFFGNPFRLVRHLMCRHAIQQRAYVRIHEHQFPLFSASRTLPQSNDPAKWSRGS